MREFLGIPLPETSRRAAVAARSVLTLPGDGWRPAREEGLHVTVRFLGEVEQARHAVCDAAWREAARGVGRLTLRLRGAAVSPPAGRPRILWLGVWDESADARLSGLADRIERAARTQGFPPEERPFAAHVTLARARRGVAVVRPVLPPESDLGAFVADRLVLYRSQLASGGSIYHEEASYPLGSEVAS